MAKETMLYVVDGYNLAFRSFVFAPAIERGGLQAVRGLVFDKIAEDCARRKCKAVLVWDGTQMTDYPPRSDKRGVEESFSRAPERADERIIALALQEKASGRPVTIVSSDKKDVQSEATRRGLQWIDCDDYEAQLFQPRRSTAFSEDYHRIAGIAIARLQASGLIDLHGRRAEVVIEDLAEALSYKATRTSDKPHKQAKSFVALLKEFGIAVHGEPHEQRAVLTPIWERSAQQGYSKDQP